MVTATFPPYQGGTGTVAFHNARILADRGHDVTVFTSQPDSDSDKALCSSRAHVSRLFTPFRVGNAPLCPTLMWKLDSTFDIVHAHYPFIFGAEIAAVAAARTPALYVLTVHNLPDDDSRPKKYCLNAYRACIQPVVMNSASRIIGVRRRHLLSKLPSLASDCRVRELANGVDLHLFHPLPRDEARHRLRLPLDGPVALFVGSLDSAHRFKGLDVLLHAFDHIRVPQSRLLIAGGGNLLPAFKAKVNRLHLAHRVQFLGGLRPEDLPPVYSAADVLVLPSTGVESFGLVALEALACATCAIVTDLPGLDESVEQGVDGFVVPPRDVEGLREAMSHVLSHQKLAGDMGSRGRKRVERFSSWESVGQRLEGIYCEALEASGRARFRSASEAKRGAC